jgi:eukaryotic-like serine/threonine-protein kinase
MTAAGIILGTAAYMSPEQAKGKAADKRSDIWAFGCVLYEMLTGTRAFEAEDAAETVAAVLTRDPPLDRVPPQARRLVERCLQRDRRQRLRGVGDAMLLLDDTEDERGPGVARSANRWPLLLAGAVATMAIGVGAGAMYGRQTLASVRRTDVQLTIVPGDRISLRPVGGFNATP